MRFLIVGDVVGRPGLDRLNKDLKNIIEQENIDFCIVNGENSANGKGLRKKEYDEILSYGADCVTMGNHIYYRKEMAAEYKNLERLLIPANITNLEGNGSIVVKKNNVSVGVINLIGQAEMGEIFKNNTTNPFTQVLTEIDKLNKEKIDYIFVDFHAEATAEKIAMGYYLEEKVNCVFGTHTHVQTADEIILSSGLAYITDIGMVGPRESVLGLKKEVALKRFSTGSYAKYECSTNEAIFNAVIVEIDDNTKKAISITRINR